MNFIATEKNDPYVGDLETHIYNASSQIAKSLELLADFESNNAEETNRVREVVAAPTLKSHENEVKYWNKLVQKLSAPAYAGSPTSKYVSPIPKYVKKKTKKSDPSALNDGDAFDKKMNKHLQKQRRIINRLIRPSNYHQTSLNNLKK